MKKQGFNLEVEFKGKDNEIKKETEFHTNKEAAENAVMNYVLKHGEKNIVGFNVNPVKDHLELKKEPTLPQRDDAYGKIK